MLLVLLLLQHGRICARGCVSSSGETRRPRAVYICLEYLRRFPGNSRWCRHAVQPFTSQRRTRAGVPRYTRPLGSPQLCDHCCFSRSSPPKQHLPAFCGFPASHHRSHASGASAPARSSRSTPNPPGFSWKDSLARRSWFSHSTIRHFLFARLRILKVGFTCRLVALGPSPRTLAEAKYRF